MPCRRGEFIPLLTASPRLPPNELRRTGVAFVAGTTILVHGERSLSLCLARG